MNHIIRLLILLIISSQISHAQILKGKITNPSGEPIQYSTVYIQELKQGTTSNTKGNYEINLPAGKYTVIYQNLGYEPIFASISLTDKTVIKDVILPPQYYEIPEVRITASGEDPAYEIMRKVISTAPYYLNNVIYAKSEVYLKGNLVIKKIPKIFQKSLQVEARNDAGASANSTKMKEGDSYLMESINEIEYTAPDHYIQKVISINSTFPDQGNDISPMDFIQASFYQPVLADMAISPLSPVAFSHYKYEYIGSSLQGKFIINKIKVIPRRKSQQLFEGTIYIVEDLWCLHSVDLTNNNLVGKIKVQQLYIEVQDEIWLPVSHKFEINLGIMGFKAEAGYGSSVKYIEVQANKALQKPQIISADYTARLPLTESNTDTIVTKEKLQMDKILEKEEMSNRDMIKLARLMKKESERSINDSSKNELEIRDNTTHIIEEDANKRDSAYWAQIRPIPLSDIEILSLKKSDSTKRAAAIQVKNDTVSSDKKKGNSKFFKTMKQIGFGHTWSDTTGFRFKFGGLIDIENLSFNSVDGFVYGLDFRFSKLWKNNQSISIYPDIRWAFSRKQPVWSINTNYKFNGLKQRQIFIRTGVKSKDLGNRGGINLFVNSASSLLFKKNYLKLYQSGYLTFGYRTELINGLYLELNTSYEDRRVLQNNTNFSFLNTSKDYTVNLPENTYLTPGSNPINELRDQRHADFFTIITYTPYQKYKINNGTKNPVGSDWPTFSFTWQHGINEFKTLVDKYKHFDMFRIEASQDKSIGAFSNLRWNIRGGGFLDNRNLPFIDFFHFNSQPLPLLLNDYQDAFMIPSFYSLSTPEMYGEVHLKYTNPYLLLKLLPGISNTLMRENISFSWLASRNHQYYSEIGYSISQFLLLGEIGIYAGFDDFKYKNVSARLILNFN
jgi:Family of unknown function (DUF5686)/CarboxypepD_reg-like domain